MSEIVIVFLLVFIAFRELREHVERQDLMDRLMARSLPELAQVETERVRTKLAGKMPAEKTIEL